MANICRLSLWIAPYKNLILAPLESLQKSVQPTEKHHHEGPSNTSHLVAPLTQVGGESAQQNSQWRCVTQSHTRLPVMGLRFGQIPAT